MTLSSHCSCLREESDNQRVSQREESGLGWREREKRGLREKERETFEKEKEK